jgi:ectoine hydroxylase-related dioxygenase (phytanoyl-CoA dioxygenase family)
LSLRPPPPNAKTQGATLKRESGSCMHPASASNGDRFIWPTNLRHAAGQNRSTGPARSVVSCTSTRPQSPPTWTQFP